MFRMMIASALFGAIAIGSVSMVSAASSADGEAKVCKWVTGKDHGVKPFQMCMTKAEWAAKEERDAQDPNRIVCRYEDVPGTKLKGRRVCQPASAWAEDRAMHREQVELMQKQACIPNAGC